MLYNTADMEKGTAGEGDSVAILEGTQLCCTRQLRDLLHCLGGIPVLLPLLAQLGKPQTSSHCVCDLLCAHSSDIIEPCDPSNAAQPWVRVRDEKH